MAAATSGLHHPRPAPGQRAGLRRAGRSVTAKDQARSRIAAAADQLLELSHRIHAHPETAWQEHRAAGWLTDALDRLRHAVTCGAPHPPPPFTARTRTPPP